MTRRRVIAVVAVILAVITVRLVGQARAHEAADGAVRVVPASPAATATAGPAVSPSPSGSAAPSTAESGPHEDADPEVAAEAWVRAWLDTSGGKAAWLARLQPGTDRELLAGLAETDITQVPGGGKGKVLAGTKLAPIDGQADVTARVPTTVGSFDVTLTIRAERWIVTVNDVAR